LIFPATAGDNGDDAVAMLKRHAWIKPFDTYRKDQFPEIKMF
jgi:hypothetical protein